jgi:hypothetical protein
MKNGLDFSGQIVMGEHGIKTASLDFSGDYQLKGLTHWKNPLLAGECICHGV